MYNAPLGGALVGVFVYGNNNFSGSLQSIYIPVFLLFSLRDTKLVFLTVPEDGVCNLKVQSLPGWETVYNLQLNAPSMLAKCNTFQVCIEENGSKRYKNI